MPSKDTNKRIARKLYKSGSFPMPDKGLVGVEPTNLGLEDLRFVLLRYKPIKSGQK